MQRGESMIGDPRMQHDSTKPLPIAATPQGLTPGSPVWDSSSRVQLKPRSAATLPQEPMGFYTDTTVCIGCKACEVACKEWNQLPASNGGQNEMSGDSYDNTRQLDGTHWRHVKFVEQFSEDRVDGRWLMMSDVCKHCVNAPCLEVCPTGAIVRTEFDTVYIQEPVCNGCRDCIPACPQACPTQSIQFGPIDDLKRRAAERVEQLHGQGATQARLYGADDSILG